MGQDTCLPFETVVMFGKQSFDSKAKLGRVMLTLSKLVSTRHFHDAVCIHMATGELTSVRKGSASSRFGPHGQVFEVGV